MTTYSLKQQASEVGWTAPAHGMWKINVDGATSENGSLYSVGVIVRDCRGAVITARGKLLPTIYSLEVTEASAIEEGIKLACALQLPRITIESDSAIAARSKHGH